MLTDLQEKILQRLIDQLPHSASKSVGLEDLGDMAMSASKDLHNRGFVMDCSTSRGAAAILQDKGQSYFTQKNKALYGEGYSEKIHLLEGYIRTAQEFLRKGDPKGVAEWEQLLFDTLSRQIPDLGGTNFEYWYYYGGEVADKYKDKWTNDLNTIIAILSRHVADIKIEAQKEKTERLKVENNINLTQNQHMENHINITVDVAVSSVMQMDLDATLKSEISALLFEIEKLKKGADKKGLFTKVKEVLGKVAKSTAEVGLTALLTYLGQSLGGGQCN